MPLEINEHRPGPETPEHFARVLRDSPEARQALEQALEQAQKEALESDEPRILEGIFNARPVAMLLARRQSEGWRLECLVVHPATRGRGVGTETLRWAATLLQPLEVPATLRELAARAGTPGISIPE